MNKDSQVPGLYRGIQIWQLLNMSGELSLEQIRQNTSYPKASILRMLQTLIELKLVERDERTKNYKSLAAIARSNKNELDFKTKIQQCLEKLSLDLGVTAEWYEPWGNGLKLIQRSSPLESEIYVAARAGYIRKWFGELDSVTTIGYAFYGDSPNWDIGTDLWIYGPTGEKITLDNKTIKEKISFAKKSLLIVDSNYNDRGIKRLSMAISLGESFEGVITLAMVFTPLLDLNIDKYRSSLKSTVSYYFK
ncbi:MAG: helix-turn-helix domain-containing protein [Spirochaetaceae bacterium]